MSVDAAGIMARISVVQLMDVSPDEKVSLIKGIVNRGACNNVPWRQKVRGFFFEMVYRLLRACRPLDDWSPGVAPADRETAIQLVAVWARNLMYEWHRTCRGQGPAVDDSLFMGTIEDNVGRIKRVTRQAGIPREMAAPSEEAFEASVED